MRKRYSVLQVNMSSTGRGDLTIMNSFDTLEEARKYMKTIYDDMKGYTKNPRGYLETMIIDNDKEFDDMDYQIDGMIYEY